MTVTGIRVIDPYLVSKEIEKVVCDKRDEKCSDVVSRIVNLCGIDIYALELVILDYGRVWEICSLLGDIFYLLNRLYDSLYKERDTIDRLLGRIRTKMQWLCERP